MVNSGTLIPDQELEDFVREQGGMPKRLEDWDESPRTTGPANTGGMEPRRRARDEDADTGEKSDDTDISDIDKGYRERVSFGSAAE